ncbi:response regulator [Candidatus Nomurabacteria bacterium]|nr:response regulator [Candidatus Nomurabacteria bacterium]
MSKKIMLVEDDTNLREIYGARLMAEGYEIVAAQDGEAALAMAVKEKPDLIISDVMMPKISGFDMLDILRSTPETKDTKVIMMTALSQAEDKSRASELGADKYLVKSQVTLEDVARVVHELLGDEPATTQPTATTSDDSGSDDNSTATTTVNDDAQIPDDNTQATDQTDDSQVAPAVEDQLPAIAPATTSDDSQISDAQPVEVAVEPTQAAEEPSPDLPSTNLDNDMVAAETETQAITSDQERQEMGAQVEQAIQTDLTTAPHEAPVATTIEVVSTSRDPEESPSEPANSSIKRVIEPLQSSTPDINQLVAAEAEKEAAAQATPVATQIPVMPEVAVVEEPAEPPTPEVSTAVNIPVSDPAEPTNVPQAPTQPDKYTLPEPEEEAEETDPNAIAL